MKLLHLIRISIALALFSTSVVSAGPLQNCKEYTKYGVPGSDGEILCRKGYLLAHDPYYLTPIWVAEHLTIQKASGTLKRKNSFKEDPNLPIGKRAELSDYKKSGYDRGHMAPSGDMSWDAEAMKESYYLSNMVPQNPKMNQHIWKMLEEKLRQWAIDRGELYIYTGPIYAQEEIDTIGDNQVCIPTHIYKIVFDPNKVEAIAFVMPNEPLEPSEMVNYIVPIREVEEQTGLDFLKPLKKSVEDVVETERVVEMW
jgi:endonuclease G, mitochondrial